MAASTGDMKVGRGMDMGMDETLMAVLDLENLYHIYSLL